MISYTFCRYIKALSVVFGLIALILSFQLRSYLSSDGSFEASTSLVSLYGDYYMSIIMALHGIAALFFFSQMFKRVKLSPDRLDMMGISTPFEGSPIEKMKVIWAGASIPIVISLCFWSWITVVQVPADIMGSYEANMLYHLLFLIQTFYITWSFSNYDMRIMDLYDDATINATGANESE